MTSDWYARYLKRSTRVDTGMRLAIFTPFLYPFHVDLLDALNRSLEVRLFSCGIFGNYPFKDLLIKAEVLRSVDILGNKLIEPFSLVKFLFYRPSVVIVFGIESVSGLTVYFVARLIGARIIVIAEENSLTFHNNLILDFIKRLKTAVARVVYNTSDVLIAESSASQNYLIETLRVSRRKPIFVLPHGVNVERFSKYKAMNRCEAKEFIDKAFGVSGSLNERIWIGFIGELSYCKGADVLIDAIERIVKRRTLRNILFLLPNSPVLRDQRSLRDIYLRRLGKLLTSGFVIIYPLIKYDLMPILYRALDVVVLPSRLLRHTSSDRSPNVALEALASGSLIIASRVGGIPDIVGDAGILIEPNDPNALAAKLHQVLSELEKYTHLEEKARERAASKLDVRQYSLALLELLLRSWHT